MFQTIPLKVASNYRSDWVKMFPFFQPEAVRMTILGHLMNLTHLDDVLVAEEEAAEAVQMAAGSKINQVKILSIFLLIY